MDDDPEDVPEFTDYFSKRAKFVPKLSSEELQATAKLLEQIQEERKKESSVKITESVPDKKRKKKASAKDKCVETQVNTVLDDVQSSRLPLSAAAKRRLRKVQRDCLKQVKSVEAANKEVLSSLNTASVNETENDGIESDDNERFLTILYLSEISTLNYDNDEKFSAIFQRVADLLNLNVSEFLLCLRNRNIKLDDTPRSLNLSYSDIIECIPYKSQGNELSKFDNNGLQLLFQASDMKKKIEIYVHQLEVMQVIMEKYSKIRSIPLEQMLFEFDGEKISGTETPQDLDMESGSCIDVRILNADDILSRKGSDIKHSEPIIDLTVDNINSCQPDIIFCD